MFPSRSALEAKGDINGAMHERAETGTAILAIPEDAQRDTYLRLLRGCKDDVCPACVTSFQREYFRAPRPPGTLRPTPAGTRHMRQGERFRFRQA